ncbi:hypothetical protein NAB1_0261 [Lactiplantibacillus plantarum]|uniref:Uncharacterized protein n=1 Tax=Lactiplantibacillus plantarum TaxID=1590 RepID=A0AAW3RET2_LACPN|nr:hypothetical protein NAB2_2849 [Lactiplantibacillus plantarum]KZV05186.1 hypothetical protein NAB1_0261 [Lactiplantibacillus plantarum]
MHYSIALTYYHMTFLNQIPPVANAIFDMDVYFQPVAYLSNHRQPCTSEST